MEAAATDRTAGWRQGIVLLLASMLPAMGVVLLTPNLPALNTRFGTVPGGNYMVSVALTMPGLCIALLSPFAGYVVDRFGRTRALYASLILYGLFGTAPLYLDTLPQIVASRVGVGIVEAVILTSIFALFGDYYQDEARNRWMAYNGSFTAAAATCFYLIGGALGDLGWRMPFALYGISLVICVAAMFVLWEPAHKPRAERRGDSAALLAPAFVAICLVTVFSSVMFYLIPLEMGVFLQSREAMSSAVVGMLIAIASIGNPLGALAFRYVSAIRPYILLAGGYAVSGAGLVAMAMSSNLAGVAIGAFINQLGSGLFVPVLMSTAMNTLPPEARGRGGGIYTTAFFLGQFICPLVVITLTNQAGSIDRAFLGFGLISFVAFAVTQAIAIRTRRYCSAAA